MRNRLWERIRGALEAGMRQRVTRAGLLFSVSMILVALAAFVSANNLLFLLFAMMLATFLISGFVSRLTLAGLGLGFGLPNHISARRKVPARITVYNEKSWMTSFSIHLKGVPPSAFNSALYFPLVASKSHIKETVEVEFGRRGAYKENGFEFSTRFPFGFTERRIRVTLRRDVLVYPSLAPQAGFEELLKGLAGDLESNQRGRGSDFYRIRPYETTESARHVDWKATAHTGELQVREFAREQDPLVEIFLDLDAGGSHDAWFERAVDCCAFLVWNASQKDCRLRFRSQEFDLMIPAEGDVYAVLKYLALVSRKRVKNIPPPSGEEAYQMLFTVREDGIEEAGWGAAEVLRPSSLPANTAEAGE